MTLSINSWLYRVTQDTCDLTKSDYIDEETDQQKDTFYNDNENDNGNFCKEIIFCDTHDNSWHCETQMMTSMKTESDPEQSLQSLAMFGQASVSSTFLIRLVSLLPVHARTRFRFPLFEGVLGSASKGTARSWRLIWYDWQIGSQISILGYFPQTSTWFLSHMHLSTCVKYLLLFLYVCSFWGLTIIWIRMVLWKNWHLQDTT